jgi:hypothetical protein
MRTKSIAIWFLTSMTFIALIHLIEAVTVIMLNNPIRLLQLYPYGNTLVNSFTPTTYLYVTATATAVLWAATCLIAFNSPMESYVNKRVQTDERLMQDRGALLDHMCETVESDHQTLTSLTDIMRKMQKGETDEEFSAATPKIPSDIVVTSGPILTKGFSSEFCANPRTKQNAMKKKNGSQNGNVKTHAASLTLRKR